MSAPSASPFRTEHAAVLPLAGAAGAFQLRVFEGFGAAPAMPLADELFLYLQPAQLALQPSGSRQLIFALENLRTAQTVAWWPLLIGADGHSLSLPQAPFGGPQLLDAAVPLPVLTQWLAAAHDELRRRSVRHLKLRTSAFAYAPAALPSLAEALRLSGYEVTLAEINHHLPLAESYEARLHPSERRRLHKCLRHGFRFEQEPRLLLPLAYDFLRRCREEKGQDLSLSEERLTELFTRFPDNYFLFSVRDANGDWAALTVAVLAGNGVLYNFYPANPLRYNAFSPVVLLNAGLHAFGQASGLRLLDLGSSTLPTGLNESLLRFKRHLGGVPSLKLTLERSL